MARISDKRIREIAARAYCRTRCYEKSTCEYTSKCGILRSFSKELILAIKEMGRKQIVIDWNEVSGYGFADKQAQKAVMRQIRQWEAA